MARFVHSADWQLGFRRGFLDDDAQARFTQARIDAIGSIGRIAQAHDAHFVVVAGDVFESNQMDRRTVHRALEQLATIAVPVFLLPGNHDPLDASSIYAADSFVERCPENVVVLDHDDIRRVDPGTEIVGVPWTSNELLTDAVNARIDALAPVDPGIVRIMVAHGVVDQLQRDRHDPGVIDTARVEQAMSEGRLHYLALGDRHSTTSIGDSGRIWYAGAPEPTRFTEIAAGNVLGVEVTAHQCQVERMRVASWQFASREIQLAGDADVDALQVWLEDRQDVARTIVRLQLEGVVGLRTMARLHEVLDAAGERFACVDVIGLDTDLVAVVDDEDLADVDTGPVTMATIEQLSSMVAAGGETSAHAAHALRLLYAIARRVA